MKEDRYDDPVFFEKYSQMPRSQYGLEAAGEWETLRMLLPDFAGRRVLDLFAGTGAISFELLSRECARVVCVEIYPTQYNFIRKVQQLLGDHNLTPIKGDVFKFLQSCRQQFDLIFADPPYDLPKLATLPHEVLSRNLLKPGGIFVLEHSKNNDFSSHPLFDQHRSYGSVNFSIFRQPDTAEPAV